MPGFVGEPSQDSWGWIRETLGIKGKKERGRRLKSPGEIFLMGVGNYQGFFRMKSWNGRIYYPTFGLVRHQR